MTFIVLSKPQSRYDIVSNDLYRPSNSDGKLDTATESVSTTQSCCLGFLLPSGTNFVGLNGSDS